MATAIPAAAEKKLCVASADHLGEVAHGGFRRVRLPVGVGGETGRRIPAQVRRHAIDEARLDSYAGVRRYHFGETDEEDLVGMVTGLAWTEFGGDILTIEAVKMPGRGRMSITGNLKEVMKESISARPTLTSAPGRPTSA